MHIIFVIWLSMEENKKNSSQSARDLKKKFIKILYNSHMVGSHMMQNSHLCKSLI